MGVTDDGRVEPVALATKLSFMPWERRAGFVASLFQRRGPAAQQMLRTLIAYLKPRSQTGQPFTTIRVYREVVSVQPGNSGRVVQTEMILTQRELL